MDAIHTMTTGKVVALVSAKGGVGQTFLATNLAIALQKKFLSITLVDGKLQFGDIAIALDLHAAVTVKDVAENIADMDHSMISNYLSPHESGIQVLAAPERPEQAELVTPDVLKKTISMLREHYDYTVVDCGYAFHETTLDILDVADHIFVVTTPDMTALKNTKQLLDTFRQLEYTNKIQLIINRYDMEGLIKAEDIPEMLQMGSVEYICNDFKLASKSLNIGIPVVGRRSSSELSKNIVQLALGLLSKNEEEPTLGRNREKKKWLPFKK
ncbi:AAA family ATPase [Paenisporosarcina cavernae]|uniref:MinD/ParA family protein n=1 Tax=Paenisporosarcina cavernae TaxID=2320858 RepID=A0A385YT44_9BACL|nr:AAA family ATPase [Paenisporosarcina cavernae]AYC28633.1 MinD/ParA family protein [Paenisporosarcina cavernae]